MSTFVTKRAKDLGLKTEDARSNLVLEVLPDDVKRAKVKNAKCCAFARACKRQMPKVKAAYFFRSTAWLEYEDKMVRYMLPLAVQKEIVSFDRSQKMEPGTYAISKPSGEQKLGGSKFAKGKSWAARSTAARKEGCKKMGPKRAVRNKTKGVRTLAEPADA